MLLALGKKKDKLLRDICISSNQTNPNLAPNNFPSFQKKKKKKLYGSFNIITTVMVPASGAKTSTR